MESREVKIKNRDSNIELLRIILMIMIITHHLLVGPANLKLMNSSMLNIDILNIIKVLLNSFVIISVNCFIFISGYYGIKFRSSKIINLIMQAIFYSIVISIIFMIFLGKNITINELIFIIVPINMWWFLTCYIALMVFAPYINILVDSINKFKMYFLVSTLTIVVCVFGVLGISSSIITLNSGYTLIGFIYMYLLGRIFKKSIRDFNLRISIMGYLLATIGIFISVLIVWRVLGSNFAWRLFGYNNPVVIVSSIFFFYIFKNIRINRSEIINTIAMYCIGIYLIHEHFMVRAFLSEKLIFLNDLNNPVKFIFILLICVLIIFIVAFIIEIGRSLLFQPLSKKIIEIEVLKEIDKKLE